MIQYHKSGPLMVLWWVSKHADTRKGRDAIETSSLTPAATSSNISKLLVSISTTSIAATTTPTV